ncbi:MAG: hypothetical protein WKG06_40985 [Segetibacter sp.]
MKTIASSALHKVIFFLLLIFNSSAYSQQNIGLEFYTFRDQFAKDVPGTLSMIHKMGIKEVEIGGTYGMPETEFKQLLQKNELDVIAVAADFNDLAKNPQKAADEAKKYGAKYLVCFWIPHTGTEFTIDDAKKAISVFNNAGKVAAENGLQFCYHAHGFEFRPYNNRTLIRLYDEGTKS